MSAAGPHAPGALFDAVLLRPPPGAFRGALGWLLPPAAHAVELTSLALLGFLGGAPGGAVYALLAVLVLHHYDGYYRLKAGLPPPPWLVRAGLGWDGRVVVVGVGVLAGAATATVGALTAWCGVLFVVESVRVWVRDARTTGRAVDLDA